MTTLANTVQTEKVSPRKGQKQTGHWMPGTRLGGPSKRSIWFTAARHLAQQTRPSLEGNNSSPHTYCPLPSH